MTNTSSLTPGLIGQATRHVTDAMTAPSMGSGTIEVFATPAMIALMEEAAVACIEPYLAEGEASLGVHLDASHSAPTPIGMEVTARAVLVAVDGRKLTFEIEASDAAGLIGKARHTRIIVDRARFEARVAARAHET